jgi:hypothetical protein
VLYGFYKTERQPNSLYYYSFKYFQPQLSNVAHLTLHYCMFQSIGTKHFWFKDALSIKHSALQSKYSMQLQPRSNNIRQNTTTSYIEAHDTTKSLRKIHLHKYVNRNFYCQYRVLTSHTSCVTRCIRPRTLTQKISTLCLGYGYLRYFCGTLLPRQLFVTFFAHCCYNCFLPLFSNCSVLARIWSS